MHEFATLKEFFVRNKWRYLAGVLSLLVVDSLQLVMPQILRLAADALQAGVLTTHALLRYVGLLLLVAAVVAAGRFGWRILINGAARQLERELRDRFFAHLEKLSANYFNEHTVGDLMAHATNDIGAIRMAVGPGIVMSVDSVFLSMAGLATMVSTINLKLTGLALLPMPLLVAGIIYFGHEINRRFRRVQESFANLTSTAEENLNGMRVVKAFVQEKAEMAKFSERNQDYIARNMYLVRIWGLFDPLMQWLTGISLVIVIGYGGYLTLNGTISLGDFVAFNGYLGLITGPIMGFGWVINNLQRGVASMARINAVLRQVPEIQDAAADQLQRAVQLNGAVEFRHLTFRYRPELPAVLTDINLRIEPGETVGILGRTGSGKSTLVNLLLRVYDPPAGTVLVGGVDVRDLPLATLREQIGYVPQENFLFSTTVAENIAFSQDHSDQTQVEQAARLAAVADDIEAFPAGYRTIVGERGVTLSGGQKQRVAIARAVLKNPRVLVLDDCLSAVDTQTEEQILSGLVQVMRQRTSILISHRISTLQRADRIIVLDQGRVVESGTHEELLRRQGLYWETYERQLLEDKLAKEA